VRARRQEVDSHRLEAHPKVCTMGFPSTLKSLLVPDGGTSGNARPPAFWGSQKMAVQFFVPPEAKNKSEGDTNRAKDKA